MAEKRFLYLEKLGNQFCSPASDITYFKTLNNVLVDAFGSINNVTWKINVAADDCHILFSDTSKTIKIYLYEVGTGFIDELNNEDLIKYLLNFKGNKR